MASYPRYLIISDHSTFHVTWLCHNHTWLLQEDWAKKYYYSLLLKYKDRYGIKIHSYCFMDNHPHLTGTLISKERFSDFFRLVNSMLAKAINKKNQRRGQVVMDRFKSPRIETDRHLLEVMLYVDMNPFRAGKVKHPREYAYSSYGYYAYGKHDPLLDPPDTYLALGATPEARQKAYRDLLEFVMSRDKKKKANYSHTCFIGNPNWVVEKKRELQEGLQFKKAEKKLRASG